MTSEVIWSDILTRVIEVIQHNMPISHRPCRRRYIGPLPSCFYQRRKKRRIIDQHFPEIPVKEANRKRVLMVEQTDYE